MKNVINIHSCENIVVSYSDIRDYKDLVGFFERELKNKVKELNIQFKHVFSHVQEPKDKESLEWKSYC